MNEQYFNHEYMGTFDPTFWFMLKLRLFGKRIVERAGRYTAVFYAYKGKLYLHKYDAF